MFIYISLSLSLTHNIYMNYNIYKLYMTNTHIKEHKTNP